MVLQRVGRNQNAMTVFIVTQGKFATAATVNGTR